MNLKKFAATSVLVIAALGVGTGTSYAAPAPAPDPVGYQTHVDGRSVVTVLDAGGFHVTSDGQLIEVRNDAGDVLQTLPLSIRVGDREFSIAPVIEGRTLTLTPVDAPRDVAAPVADVAAPFEFGPDTLAQLANGVGDAVTIGSLIGTVVGALVGCVAPASVGAAAATCLPGLAAGAGIGGVVGTIAGGGAALAGNGSAMLNAPA